MVMKAIPLSPDDLQRILFQEHEEPQRHMRPHPLAQKNELELRMSTIKERLADYPRYRQMIVPGTMVVEDPMFQTHVGLAEDGILLMTVLREINLDDKDDQVRLADHYAKCDCLLFEPNVIVAFMAGGQMHCHPHSTLQLIPYVHEE